MLLSEDIKKDENKDGTSREFSVIAGKRNFGRCHTQCQENPPDASKYPETAHTITMQTTRTAQATSYSSSEPVGKAKVPKKWKSVAIQLTVYSSFADGNNYNGENQNPQPLVDRMTTVPLAERQYPAAQTKDQCFWPIPW